MSNIKRFVFTSFIKIITPGEHLNDLVASIRVFHTCSVASAVSINLLPSFTVTLLLATNDGLFTDHRCLVGWYCIVLYCIMRPYTYCPIGPLSYRHSSVVVRQPRLALAERRIFNLRSISPQRTHLLIARRRNSFTSVLASIS